MRNRNLLVFGLIAIFFFSKAEAKKSASSKDYNDALGFIKANGIEIKNVTKEYIKNKLDEYDIPMNIYNNASIRSISKESIDKMKKEIEGKIRILEDLINTHHLQIWHNELHELQDFYIAEIKKRNNNPSNVTTKEKFDKIINNYIDNLKVNKEKRLNIKKRISKK